MGSVRLRISVADIVTVMASYDVIRVKKSTAGEGGPFSDITAAAASAATLTAPTAGTYDVVSKTLQILRDGHGQVDIQFTGGIVPLTTSEVVDQINAEVGVDIASDVSNALVLTSTITGSESKIEIVGGSAATDFGWSGGERNIGKEPYLTLQSNVSLYEFVDDDGEAGYYYVVNYFNTVNSLSSKDSSPFLGSTATLISASNLSIAKVDWVDGQGQAVPDVVFSFYQVYEPLQVEGLQVALHRASFYMETDNAGHAETTLVRGAKFKVVIEGTNIIREITVPDQTEFDLLALMGTANDPFDVAEPNFPAAPRRTL